MWAAYPAHVRISLFQRVTRYRTGAALNPRENRLTEATAAVLESVDGLALAFARHLVAAGDDDAHERGLVSQFRQRAALHAYVEKLSHSSVEVDTQVPTIHGRYIDLELVLRPPPRSGERGLLMWVEVKHGAAVHADQLDVYLEDIKHRFAFEDLERVVVLLGPRGWEPRELVDPLVLRVDWQSVAREVEKFEAPFAAPEQRWLLDQYIEYLKEEALSDPDALTTASALALMEWHRASEAAAGICEHAGGYIESRWGKSTSASSSGFGTDSWARYRTHSNKLKPHSRWDGHEFEWGLVYAPSLANLAPLRGGYVFYAGSSTYYKKNAPALLPANREWRATLESQGFQATLYYHHLFARLLFPDELLTHTSLEAQGRAVGEWVVEAFTLLRGSPPKKGHA